LSGFRRLRLSANNRWTPVIVVSALTEPHAIQRCRALRANAFVPKPIARTDLVAAMRDLRVLHAH
jgi:CheY-like chemotaxis protein